LPYFEYFVSVNPANNTKKLEYVDKLDSYKEARELARTKRAEMGGTNVNHDCRLIFAKTQPEAEKLLSAPREERIIGED